MSNSIVLSGTAGSALTAFQLVKFDAAGQLVPCTASTHIPAGVVQRSCNSGDLVEYVVSGVTNVVAGGVITSGTDFFLQPAAAGKVVKFTSAANVVIVGRFLPYEANLASADGEIVRCIFNPAIGNA
jgi:hypothetical protein